MKTIAISTIMFFFTFINFSLSQTADHLVFKGVPIDGTLNDYISKMEKEGFKHNETEDGIAILNGDFAGFKGCSIKVSTLKQKDLVYNISVVFNDSETWSSLSENYLELKEMLTEKYGKPSDILEKFEVASYMQPRDDNDRIHYVKFDKCKYFAIWKSDKGEIKLSIEHENINRCFVRLSYFDRINSNIIKTQAKKDL